MPEAEAEFSTETPHMFRSAFGYFFRQEGVRITVEKLLNSGKYEMFPRLSIYFPKIFGEAREFRSKDTKEFCSPFFTGKNGLQSVRSASAQRNTSNAVLPT